MQYALDLAAHFMAEDSKPTPTPAKTDSGSGSSTPHRREDRAKGAHIHFAQLLQKHKDDGNRGRKSGRGDGCQGRGRGRGGGRGGHSSGDGAAHPWPANFS